MLGAFKAAQVMYLRVSPGRRYSLLLCCCTALVILPEGMITSRAAASTMSSPASTSPVTIFHTPIPRRGPLFSCTSRHLLLLVQHEAAHAHLQARKSLTAIASLSQLCRFSRALVQIKHNAPMCIAGKHSQKVCAPGGRRWQGACWAWRAATGRAAHRRALHGGR